MREQERDSIMNLEFDKDFNRWRSNTFPPYYEMENHLIVKRAFKKLSRINTKILLNIHLNRSKSTIEALRSLKKFILAAIKDIDYGRYSDEKKRGSIRHDTNNARSSILFDTIPDNARNSLADRPKESE